MLGSVNPHPRKNGTYFLTFKHSKAEGYYNESFTITEYKTAAKAKAAAEARRTELQPEFKKISNVRTGTSYVDKLYKDSKAFQDFTKEYAKNTDKSKYKNFYKLNATDKINLNDSYKRYLERPGKEGFNTTIDQLAEKLNLSKARLQNVGVKERLGKYIDDKFPSVKSIIPGKIGAVRMFKDPTEVQVNDYFKNFKSDQSALPKKLLDRIKNIDNVFRETVINGEKFIDGNNVKKTRYLPSVVDVISKVDSINTSSEAAVAMANYAKILRGAGLEQGLNIKEDIAAGERLLNNFSKGSRGDYKKAFYNYALSNIDKKNYDNKGKLTDFRNRFNTELRDAMGLTERYTTGKNKGKYKVSKLPYNINEVISISAGESRGIQPFSVFVDATNARINSGELSGYQGTFSRKLSAVEDLIKAGKMDEATKLAATLKGDQAAVGQRLLEQGFNQKQINQINFPEIVVGDKVDSRFYSPEQLKDLKAKGVDIEGFAKDRKFYIDTKGTKPFFEVGDEVLRATALKLARNNTGNICNIVTQNVAGGGRIGFATGGNCVTQVAAAFDADPIKTAQDINKLPEASGAINKVKSAASKFLSVAKKGGRFAAFAGVGAAASAVKQFMSDDPTSYLSDENQQKNMLIDMVTEPVMEERDPGITSSAQLPVLGAVTAAGAIPGGAEYYKERRGIRPNDKFTGPMQKGVGKIRAAASPISGLLGKGLAATGTPLGMLALEPLYIGSQLAAGDSAGEIATNPINYLGAAFASPLTQQATKFASPAVSNIMRLGISPTALKTVSRRFGLPGLALSAGISGYEMFNNYRQGRGLFDDG